jgi:transcriptional regulator with XRE-family HTH domain
MNAYAGKGYSQEVDKHVGKQIRQLRWRFNMTQQQLAEKVGVKFQQIQKYETGVNRVAASRLFDMAQAFGISVTHFFPVGDVENTPTLDKRSLELVNAFSKLPETQQDTILRLIKDM